MGDDGGGKLSNAGPVRAAVALNAGGLQHLLTGVLQGGGAVQQGGDGTHGVEGARWAFFNGREFSTQGYSNLFRPVGSYFAPSTMPMIHVVFRGVLSTLCLFVVLPAMAQYTVDSVQDGADANPGRWGLCHRHWVVHVPRRPSGGRSGRGPVDITLPEGNYNWILGQEVLDQGDITVNGRVPGPTIVNADGNSRFFELSGGSTIVAFHDFELRNGFDGNDPGGAMENDCDDLTLSGMVFRDCETGIGFGGGIHNRGVMTVEGCLFIGCVAEGNDGQNGGGGGGGALGAGGAVSAWQGSSSTFENCAFTDCIARGGDGGDGQLGGGGGQGGQSFTNFGEGGNGGNIGGGGENAGSANIGGGGGGGGFSTGWLGNNPGDGSNGIMFGGNGGDGSNNGAAGGGGGAGFGGAFFSRAGDHTFRHCTFSGNQAIPGEGGNSAGGTLPQDGTGRGGAIGTYAGTITLDNCILFGNSAMGSPIGVLRTCFCSVAARFSPIRPDTTSLAMENADETVFDAAATGNQLGVDPLLLPFGDYGGQTDALHDQCM